MAFPKPLAEFDFDFALNQELHGLRGKLHRVETILAGSIRVLTVLRQHSELITVPETVSKLQCAHFDREVCCVMNHFMSHQSTCAELLRISSDIKSMVTARIPQSIVK